MFVEITESSDFPREVLAIQIRSERAALERQASAAVAAAVARERAATERGVEPTSVSWLLTRFEQFREGLFEETEAQITTLLAAHGEPASPKGAPVPPLTAPVAVEVARPVKPAIVDEPPVDSAGPTPAGNDELEHEFWKDDDVPWRSALRPRVRSARKARLFEVSAAIIGVLAVVVHFG